MKAIQSFDIDNWNHKLTCNSCLTSLEVDEFDLFILYQDRHMAFNIVLLNDIVNYYCTCMNCEERILVHGVPKLIQSRVANIYPPPIRIKKKWYQNLF